MKKRLLSILLTACMVLSLLPTAALATDNSTEVFVNNVKLDATTPYLVSNRAANSGTLGEGGCTAYFDVSTGTLTLHNAAITTPYTHTPGHASGIYAAGNLNLVLAPDTTNAVTITAQAMGSNHGIYAAGTLKISGAGTLNATAGESMYDVGISSAIAAGKAIEISDATITATGGKAAGVSVGIFISSDFAGTTTIHSGTVTATGGAGKFSYGIGFNAGVASCLTINSGTVTAISSTATLDDPNSSVAINRNVKYASTYHHAVSAGTTAFDAKLIGVPAEATYKNRYVKIEPAYKISGTITDGKTNTALPDATVQLKKDSSTSVYAPVTTDEHGSFTILAVPAGEGYFIDVNKIGYNNGRIVAFDVVDVDVAGRDLALARATAYVNGVELNETTPYWKNGDPTATATADGYNAYFNVPTGTLTLSGAIITATYANPFGASGIYANGSLDLVLAEGTTNTVAITISKQTNHGIYAAGPLKISGAGTLNVTAGPATRTSYAIGSGRDIDISDATVTATGGGAPDFWSYGILADGTVTIHSGAVTATAGVADVSYGINASIHLEGGTLTATGNSWATRGNVTYGNAYKHAVYAGTAADNAALVTTPTADTYKSKYVKIAQTYSISGTITGSDAPDGLEGAAVQLTDSTGTAIGDSVSTDVNGAFTIPAAPVGTHRIAVSKTGYQNGTISNVTVANVDVTGKTLELLSTALYVNGVKLTAGSPYWKNGDTATATGTAVDYNAHFDADTRTLTLKSATIDTAHTLVSSGSGIYTLGDLKLVLTPGTTNIVTTAASSGLYSYGIYVLGSLKISGAGTLNATAGTSTGTGAGSYAIQGGDTIDITDAAVTATGGTAANQSSGIYTASSFTIHSGTVTAVSGTATICKAIDASVAYADSYKHAVYAGTAADSAALVAAPTAVTYKSKYVKIAPTYSISGTITGSDAPDGLKGAVVQLQDSTGTAFGSSVSTDASGDFTIPAAPAGDYSIAVSKTGYTSGTIGSFTVVNADVGGRNLKLVKASEDVTITISDIAAQTYTGKQLKPSVTVKTAANATIDPANYTLSYGANLNAGTPGTVTVTAKDSGAYTFTAQTANFTINKKTIAVQDVTCSAKTYDKTAAAVVTGVSFTGTENSESLVMGTDYTATATFDSADAGNNRTLTRTVTLIPTGSVAKNYTLTDDGVPSGLPNQSIGKASYTGSITKTMLFTQLTAHSGTIVIGNFTLPEEFKDAAIASVTKNTDTENILTLDGATFDIAATAKSGDTATCNVVISSMNYNDFTATFTIEITNKTPVDVTGVVVANKTYDGTAVSHTGSPVAKQKMETK